MSSTIFRCARATVGPTIALLHCPGELVVPPPSIPNAPPCLSPVSPELGSRFPLAYLVSPLNLKSGSRCTVAQQFDTCATLALAQPSLKLATPGSGGQGQHQVSSMPLVAPSCPKDDCFSEYQARNYEIFASDNLDAESLASEILRPVDRGNSHLWIEQLPMGSPQSRCQTLWDLRRSLLCLPGPKGTPEQPSWRVPASGPGAFRVWADLSVFLVTGPLPELMTRCPVRVCALLLVLPVPTCGVGPGAALR